jgi:hypothetical protein
MGEFQQQLIQRRMQAMRMQVQEIPTFQVKRRLRKTEEGQGQQDKEEYMPSLQEVPLQEAPTSRTGQVHVKQEVQGLPL